MAAGAVEADCDLTAEDSSPVSELSFSLQSLQCQDGWDNSTDSQIDWLSDLKVHFIEVKWQY